MKHSHQAREQVPAHGHDRSMTCVTWDWQGADDDEWQADWDVSVATSPRQVSSWSFIGGLMQQIDRC